MIMRVCLVGHHVNNPDEGARNVTFQLFKTLAKQHQVTAINICNIGEWFRISAYRPDVVHFLLGPASVLSFVAAKTISLLYRPARTVMSAIQPFYPRFTRWMALLRPDLVLVQSRAAEKMFSQAGCKATFLPNGVDTHRFVPVLPHHKIVLKEKYNIASDRFVVLHVGAISKGRNVHLLAALQDEGRQVVIVGRPSETADQELLEQLRQRGCLVWTSYFSALEEVYGLSDCYVFPCTSRYHSIEMPLSVLEAMSCNLPVITTHFGALSDIFTEGQGFVFAENGEAFVRKVRETSRRRPVAGTRQQVLPYSWDHVIERVEAIYAELLS
jgi:glycosyltransferase involved in cell wall biosynthesis